MEPTFTLASLFWLFVPMSLLIVFSLVSLFNQMKKEKQGKNEKNEIPPIVDIHKNMMEKRGS